MLLLLPLLRRRADARPAAAVTAVSVLLVMLLGGAGLYAAFSNFAWIDTSSAADTPAAMTARLAKRLAKGSDTVEEWLHARTFLRRARPVPPGAARLPARGPAVRGQKCRGHHGHGRSTGAAGRGRAARTRRAHVRARAGARPDIAQGLFYSAFAALGRDESALARQRFEQMLAGEQDPDVRVLLEKGIESAAQQEARLAGGAEPARDAAPDAAKIAVHVTLAPALAAKVPDSAALFVAARDPQAPGPPFAVKRLAARFPIDVELTAADAMLPSRRIAVGQQLDVVARVALGGTPTASSGDPFGQVSYHVGKDGKLNIVIDRLAP